MDMVLYGTKDFWGIAYFDELALEKVGLIPLHVTILGPSSLGYKETGIYTGDVSRGSGDYSYQWYIQYDGSSAWYPLGTQQTQKRSMLNRGFTLEVDVTDTVTGAEGSATKHVEYEGILSEKPVK